MKTLAIIAAGLVSVIGLSVPVMAQEAPQTAHEEDHDELNGEHGTVHRQLGAIHEDAHEDGLSPWEHQQLHRQLGRAHERADTNIDYQHELEHQSQAYLNRSYSGYGSGYGRYNQNYGYNGYQQGNGYYVPSTRGYYVQRARPIVRYYRYSYGHRRY